MELSDLEELVVNSEEENINSTFDENLSTPD